MHALRSWDAEVRATKHLHWAALISLALGTGAGFLPAQDSGLNLAERYLKEEHRIPVRDGVRLFTAVYRPREATDALPIMLLRTPYGIRPYGPDRYPSVLGPSPEMAEEGYIFVYQDVRGRFRSEGAWRMMTPHRADKAGPADVDESTDTHDTIAWLLENVPGHNGRVGTWGISYPGFYAAAGLIDAHHSLIAASPQAPAIDMFLGDDFHHHGAFFLAHAFRWLTANARIQTEVPGEPWTPFRYPTPDGYRFFLELGTVANIDPLYLKGSVPVWNEYMAHPDYDEYWQAQSLLPHLRRIRPAVMTVGGWFDSEDLYGPLQTYQTIERQSPETVHNALVMGPWIHGGWARSEGDRLGHISFGAATAAFYRREVEAVFFRAHLKEGKAPDLPEALVFATGENRWRRFETWPPAEARSRALHLHDGELLSWDSPERDDDRAFDQYLSDPRRPVPFTAEIRPTMGHEFMIEDQRFAWMRPDVLSYETPPLEEAVTLVGPLRARLFVATTGTDADYVVKLIDVFPPDVPDPDPNPAGVRLAQFQMLVRGEVMRARYRLSYRHPEPLEPGNVTEIAFVLQDICHTFQPGHRIMVQVQSSWFPLVDRNPQRFVDTYRTTLDDFQPANHQVWRTRRWASRLEVLELPR